jgi:hypothetical protein
VRVADGARQTAVLGVIPPEVVDADGRDVDPELVHDREAFIQAGSLRVLLERCALDDLAERHVPVGMHVHDADALSANPHLASGALRLYRGQHAVETAVSRDVQARGSARGGPDERSAIRHRLSPSVRVAGWQVHAFTPTFRISCRRSATCYTSHR